MPEHLDCLRFEEKTIFLLRELLSKQAKEIFQLRLALRKISSRLEKELNLKSIILQQSREIQRLKTLIASDDDDV